jgi:TonB family protein
VSDEPIYGATTTIYATEGGGGAKWLLGAAAAAFAMSSGYFAWKNNTPSTDNVQVAAYDPYAGGPIRAAPLPPSAAMIAANAAAVQRVAARAPETPRRTRPARRSGAGAPAILEATIGVAAREDNEEIVVTRVRRAIWASTPSPRRLAALYPARALERGREGEASLQCVIQEGGALDCERESATRGGFAAAALRVARRFRHAPQLADGSDAAGAQVRLRVVFRIADDERRMARRDDDRAETASLSSPPERPA